MCSNEKLKGEIGLLKKDIMYLTKTLGDFHSDFKEFVDLERKEHAKIFKRFEDQDKKYVLRREMSMVKWVGGTMLAATSAFSAAMALFNK